jgi:hypothetical protein
VQLLARLRDRLPPAPVDGAPDAWTVYVAADGPDVPWIVIGADDRA